MPPDTDVQDTGQSGDGDGGQKGPEFGQAIERLVGWRTLRGDDSEAIEDFRAAVSSPADLLHPDVDQLVENLKADGYAPGLVTDLEQLRSSARKEAEALEQERIRNDRELAKQALREEREEQRRKDAHDQRRAALLAEIEEEDRVRDAAAATGSADLPGTSELDRQLAIVGEAHAVAVDSTKSWKERHEAAARAIQTLNDMETRRENPVDFDTDAWLDEFNRTLEGK